MVKIGGALSTAARELFPSRALPELRCPHYGSDPFCYANALLMEQPEFVMKGPSSIESTSETPGPIVFLRL